MFLKKCVTLIQIFWHFWTLIFINENVYRLAYVSCVIVGLYLNIYIYIWLFFIIVVIKDIFNNGYYYYVYSNTLHFVATPIFQSYVKTTFLNKSKGLKINECILFLWFYFILFALIVTIY